MFTLCVPGLFAHIYTELRVAAAPSRLLIQKLHREAATSGLPHLGQVRELLHARVVPIFK